MAGLAVGSYFIGKLIDGKPRNPARFFGQLEIGIGVCGVLILSNDVMLSELSVLIREIARDREVRVVVITGGEVFFAAGADIKLVSALASPLDAYEFSRNNPIPELERLEKPVSSD